MRATIIFLNFFVVLFFGVFFAYTFVGKKHIESLARDYAISKTVAYVTPLVDSLAENFQKKTVQLLTPEKQKKQIQSQIDSFRRNPDSYLERLAKESSNSASQSKLLEKLAPFRSKALLHLNKKIDALLRDLRIFSGSNFVAGFVALLFAFRSPPKVRALLVWLSFLMFVAVCFASYIYIDDFSFFRILSGGHMGWFYPFLLSYFIIRLFWEGWRGHVLVEQIDEALNQTEVKVKPRP